MAVPQNAQLIWNSLKRYPLSDIQCAGILGNIEQESGGDPETVGPNGGGLFQFNPSSKCPGCYTGNVGADIDSQVTNMILQGGGTCMMGATTAAQAADMFMTCFEKCSQCDSGNREQSANDVLAAAQSGNWKSTGLGGSLGGAPIGNLGGATGNTCSDMKNAPRGQKCVLCIPNFVSEIEQGINDITPLVNPFNPSGDWCLWRVSNSKAFVSAGAVVAGAFVVSVGAILLAIWGLHDTKPGQQIAQSAKRAASGAITVASFADPEVGGTRLALKAATRGAGALQKGAGAARGRLAGAGRPRLSTGVGETAGEIQAGTV